MAIDISEIIIDEGFKMLLPPLDDMELAGLEEQLLRDGCIHPLVLWNGILIDGHNRYGIIKEHNLAFDTISMDFDSREDVVIWIIKMQVSRRNLEPKHLSYFRGLHYNMEKLVQSTTARRSYEHDKSQIETLNEGSTARRLAEHYNVSRNTIIRDSQLANSISAIGAHSPDAKRTILAGDTRITRQEIRQWHSEPEETIREIALGIEDGTFMARRNEERALMAAESSDADDADIHPLEKMFGQMTDDFSAALRAIATQNDSIALRTALRSYIDRLEALYESVG
ncbi:MAG: hypothetical protein FWC66_03930 [Oscillospiraceae bacterium]|nr:hypothetical protein [Oscillospiraceae bacterium]